MQEYRLKKSINKYLSITTSQKVIIVSLSKTTKTDMISSWIGSICDGSGFGMFSFGFDALKLLHDCKI